MTLTEPGHHPYTGPDLSVIYPAPGWPHTSVPAMLAQVQALTEILPALPEAGAEPITAAIRRHLDELARLDEYGLLRGSIRDTYRAYADTARQMLAAHDEQAEYISDEHAMNSIAAILAGTSRDPSTIEAVAAVVARTARAVPDHAEFVTRRDPLRHPAVTIGIDHTRPGD